MGTPSAIIYNASSGSDTGASGSGPATPLTGTSASYSGSVFTLDGTPDLSGITTSHCLYVNTSTGRKLFSIASVNDGADQITVDDAPAGTTTGLSWAIGGKRQTLQGDTGRRDYLDMKPGWIFEFEAGTYDIGVKMTISTTQSSSSNFATFQAASGASPIIRSTTNAPTFEMDSAGLVVKGIKFTTSSGTKTLTAAVRGLNPKSTVNMIDCEIDSLQYGFIGNYDLCPVLLNCYIHDCVSDAFYTEAYGNRGSIIGCVIKDNGGWGITVASGDSGSGPTALAVSGCIIHNNTSGGIDFGYGTVYSKFLHVTQSVIDGNGGDGIQLNTLQVYGGALIVSNVITNNSAYGIDDTASGFGGLYADYNAFKSNTSGDYQTYAGGANDVTLTADPYTAIGSDNFMLNSTAGGGADCQQTGGPAALLDGVNTLYLDIGLQRQEPAAGGGPIQVHPIESVY